MPEITYFLVFKKRNGLFDSVQEFTFLLDAWETLRKFTEIDSCEVYTDIILEEIDWTTNGERILAAIHFEPRWV